MAKGLGDSAAAARGHRDPEAAAARAGLDTGHTEPSPFLAPFKTQFEFLAIDRLPQSSLYVLFRQRAHTLYLTRCMSPLPRWLHQGL